MSWIPAQCHGYPRRIVKIAEFSLNNSARKVAQGKVHTGKADIGVREELLKALLEGGHVEGSSGIVGSDARSPLLLSRGGGYDAGIM